MEQSYWSRYRSTRRTFIREIGMAAGALTLAPAIAACGGSGKRNAGGAAGKENAVKPVKGGTLTMAMRSDVSNFDYAFVSEQYSTAVIGNCVEPLLTVDTQGQPTGLLATSWENPDDRTYVFKLRQGVKFQDGTDFNADAVVYSLNRVHRDKTSFPYPNLAYVDTIETPDQATVRLTLSGPYAPLLYNLAHHAGRVISPAIGERYGKDKLKLDLTGQGTGAFKFVEWKTEDHVTLARNENYWDRDASGIQLPYLDKLTFRVIPDGNAALASLRSGEIDAFTPLPLGGAPAKDVAGIKNDGSLSYRDRPGNSFNYLVLNEAREPFNSKELRQAICYAIDRTAITHAIFLDTALPEDVVFNPAIWTYDPDYHPYLKRDLAKAKQLLAQAGKPNGFAFTLLSSGAGGLFELMQDQLKDAGIQMTIQQLEFPKLLQTLRAGEHQAGSDGWNPGFDPDTWVYPHFSSKGVNNSRTHYNNPDVDRLLEQGRTTLDTAARKTLYQQAQKLIIDDAALCVMYAPTMVALSSRNVHDLPFAPIAGVRLSQVWKTS